MIDINIVRELNAYKKMYSHIFNVVTNVIEVCQDAKVKYMLIKAQQYTEDIYTGENICPKKLSVDEETIVFLLHTVIEQESKKATSEQDTQFIEECKDWILDFEENRMSEFLSNFEKEMGYIKGNKKHKRKKR